MSDKEKAEENHDVKKEEPKGPSLEERVKKLEDKVALIEKPLSER